MPIKLSKVPVWTDPLPAGSYIATAIKLGEDNFTLRSVDPNNIGAQGPAGPAGVGSVIYNGVGAPAPALGRDADYFINTSNGDLYTKVSNVWNVIGTTVGPAGAAGADGADGAAGAAGAAGADGSEWHQAAGVPGGGLGVDGDFYINTSNSDYYEKAAGVWNLIGNLEGAAGATGGSEVVSDDGGAMDLFETYDTGAITSFDGGIGWGDDGIARNGTIVTRTNERGETIRALSLDTNGEFARGLYVGEDWMGLDILVSWRFNGPAANMTTAGNNIYVGLCNGIVNTFKGATTNNFLGLGIQNQQFTHVSGTRWDYYTGTFSWRAYSRAGTTTTDEGGGSGSSGRRYALTEGHVSTFRLTIIQALVANRSTDRNFTLYLGDTSTTYQEFTAPTRIQHSSNLWQREIAATSKNQEWNGGSIQTWTVAHNESTGVLDTLNIVWDNADSCDVDLYGVSVRKRFY
jgi:hypothetical protein